ncbi:transglycosylase domain-containing protein [Sutcliffiella cohnii]
MTKYKGIPNLKKLLSDHLFSVLVVPFVIISSLIIGLIGYMLIIYAGNYVIDEKKLVMNSATTLVDENGEFITKLFVENRELVKMDDIPEHVQQAFIAVEDHRFYEHRGIDLKAITRAIYRDIIARSKVEGGSTITQQLVKNIFLTNEKSWLRKTKEAVIAINLEKRYTKEEILEMYLNQIYFGHGVYGIEAASNFYFNETVSNLSVEQGAMLAALPKAPNGYSPINNPTEAKNRRNVVINLLHEHGYLNADEAVTLQRKPLVVDVKEPVELEPYLTYIDMVYEEAEEKYGLSSEELIRGGYEITVPLNKQLQQIAYKHFQNNDYFPGTTDDVEGAFILMDSKDGGLLATIGGRNYVSRGLNRVNVKRQPGSTFKPLVVYGPAIEEEKFLPYSTLKDELLTYGSYEPRNHHNQYVGNVTMYDALKDSLNAPAVWTLNEMGVETGKSYLEKMDLSIKDDGLSIALGGLEEGVTPLQLTKAYRSFNHSGMLMEPYVIKQIKNKNGETIGEAKKVQKQVFSAQTAWYMTRMLIAAVEEGSGRAGSWNGELAGKTGTTNSPVKEGAIRDTWFVGYTPEVVGSIWMGYDRTTEEQYLTGGSSYPTRLFKDILREAKLDNTQFKMPQGVKDLEEPIRLVSIEEVDSKLSFHPFHFFTVTLNWEKGQDERIHYHIYSVLDGEHTKVGEVIGENTFEIHHVNVFNVPSYYIVPFNPQTEEQGEPSNEVTPTFR